MDLIKYEKACQQIAEIKTLSQGKYRRDEAMTMEKWARLAKNKILEADAWEIRIRTERRIGFVMEDDVLPVGRPKMGSPGTPLSHNGIDKKLAHRARRLRELGEKDFTLMIAEGRKEIEKSAERSALSLVLRAKRHRHIAKAAKQIAIPGVLGPFPLIYADPPWTFETYTPKGHESHRMPEDHYPVLSDSKIKEFTINGRPISDVAMKDCVLFLWCTSSNIFRAAEVVTAWGFEYKTQAVWDKMKIGLGLVFRNQHEVLLYGVRGNPPKPMELFSSVFRYPRKDHSAKPPEVRNAIEKMYPYYDTPETKLEMFARGQQRGWSCVGFEAGESKSRSTVGKLVGKVGAAIGQRI